MKQLILPMGIEITDADEGRAKLNCVKPPHGRYGLDPRPCGTSASSAKYCPHASL